VLFPTLLPFVSSSDSAFERHRREILLLQREPGRPKVQKSVRATAKLMIAAFCVTADLYELAAPPYQPFGSLERPGEMAATVKLHGHRSGM
jgi:hypothetical protein